MTSLDTTKYLPLFIAEAQDRLQQLSKDLLALESEGPTVSLYESIFRQAHSVKSSAATMGFDEIARLAHAVEDLVDALRKRGEAPGPELVAQLLESSDEMLALVGAREKGETRALTAGIVERLSTRAGSLQQKPFLKTVPATPIAAAAGPRLKLIVQIAASCRIPSVRAVLVHRKLTALGEVLDFQPPLEELKAGRTGERRLAAVLATATGAEKVKAALAAVPEVESVDAQELIREELPIPRAPTGGPASTDAERRAVRVSVEALDWFLDTAGEMLLSASRLREAVHLIPDDDHRPAVEQGADRIRTLVKEVHGRVMELRTTPLTLLTDRLPRVVFDLQRKTGKSMKLEVQGAEIGIDRAILDGMWDPVSHVLRNAADHGIESGDERAAAGKPREGRIVVTARREQDRVVLEISDDGRGFDLPRLKARALEMGRISRAQAAAMTDREAMRLAMLPGVTTAAETTDLSGRGVGMDAVKSSIEAMGGALELDSTAGKGTRVVFRLPLTTAVVNLLLVQLGDEVFGFPIAKVHGVVEADLWARGGEGFMATSVVYGEKLVRAHPLERLLQMPAMVRIGPRPFVIIEVESGLAAIGVDRLAGREEVVVRPLGSPLNRVRGLSAAAVLGSGRPIFVMDAAALVAGDVLPRVLV